MNSVASTSRDAYREHRDSGDLGAQQKRIMLFYHSKGGDLSLTRSEIARDVSMRLSSVCGRVNELIKLGYLVEGARRRCSVTGISAHPVKLPPMQLELAA